VDITIRRAIPEDVPAITRIYNYAIENTTATFDIQPKTLEERQRWFTEHTDEYPLIVAITDDTVVGWAEIKPFGTRRAYRYTVENAIYIDCDYQGKGIGTALLGELIDLASRREYHVILALIVGGNESSLRLHYKFGFELVGVMHEVGRKFDKWLDIITLQKTLPGPRL